MAAAFLSRDGALATGEGRGKVGMSTNPFLRRSEAVASGEQVARTVEHTDVSPVSDLTPLRAHYLKKTLVSLQLQDELASLLQRDALAMLGPPFRGSGTHKGTELPLLRYTLHKFVLTFPFFSSAPADFFSNKVQVFLERLLERNIVVIDPRDGDMETATALVRKLERYVCLLLSSGIHLRSQEEVVRISDADRMRVASLESRRTASSGLLPPAQADAFDVNIVAVRTIVGKGRIRSRSHDEFVLSVRTGTEHVHTSRRYSDIMRLHAALRTRFPDDDIPHPPAKDRTAMTVQDVPGTNGGSFTLTREKNRLTLRAYLHSLLAIHDVADSELMRTFLLADPIQLTPAEEEDVRARQRVDDFRRVQREEFAHETAARARELREHIGAFKADLLRPDGLSQFFDTVRQTPRVEQLPPKYKLIMEWAKTSMASGLYNVLVGKDSASQTFTQLKYVHSMVPYFMVRSILRLSNPVSIMRSLLDLFLAQPFGQKSLLQRIITGPMQDEISELKEIAKRVQARIGDAVFVRKVDAFVSVPFSVQHVYQGQASDERIDVVTAIMRSPLGGDLEQAQVHHIVQASRAYAAFKRERRHMLAQGMPEPEPNSDGAWLYEDLHVYLNLARKIHEKEQVVSLIQDSATTELLKDIITIFYAPLAEVYKAANIADTLSDVQVFIGDLIRTVEENQGLSTTHPERMVHVFMDLVQRHEQLFYNFVHQVHTKGSDLFDRLIQWVELFVNYIRDPTTNDAGTTGLGTIDLARCLPAQGAERARVLAQTDHVVQLAYQRKLRRELKTQRRLARTAVAQAGEAPEETGATDPVSEALSAEFGFGAMFGQVADVEAEESSSESEASVSDSDSDSGPEDAEHFRHSATSKSQSATPQGTDAIRALLPAFMAQLQPGLQATPSPVS